MGRTKNIYRALIIIACVNTLAFMAHAGTLASSNISGRYVREAGDEESELKVKLIPGGRVHVTGVSYWGTKTRIESGVHVSDIEFKAPIKNNRVVFYDRHPMGKGIKYKIEMIFGKNKLTVKEEHSTGYFGMNVRFEGEYKKK